MMVDVLVADLSQKLYRVGDVAKLLELKPYVIRYWESEFKKFLDVEKSSGGQKLYSQRDVETLFNIKKLLYSEGFSIAGARQKLKELKKQKDLPERSVSSDTLVLVRDWMKEFREELQGIMDSTKHE